jgi:hypothetical protein
MAIARGESREYLRTLRSDQYHWARAERKRDVLWEIVERTRYQTLPPIEFSYQLSLMRAVYLEVLRRPFITAEDGRPPRTKLFHPWGTGVKVRFDPAPDSPYTGLFETGAIGVARLSIAMTEEAYVPGIALKLLVDGRPSENLVLVSRLNPELSRDFFGPPLTNLLDPPTEPPFSQGWSLAYWWLSFVADPIGQPVEHLALVKRSGEPVAEPRAPHRLCLRAPEGLGFDPETRVDFRELLAQLAPGTEIYRMYGQPEGNGSREVLLGSIVTESEVIASSFGDEMLSFRHSRDPHGPYERRFRTLLAVVGAVVATTAGAVIYQLGRRS